MGRLDNEGVTPKSTIQTEPPETSSKLEEIPVRRKLIPIWVWLMLPFVVMLLGGWWLYQSMVVRNLSFETTTRVTTGASVVEAVKRVNKQIFIEHYEVVDIDYKQAPENWLAYLGVEQSFILLLRGNVPAGIDVTQITAESIWISDDGKRAQLTLPSPQVFEENVSIDFDRSRILAMNDTCPDFICENSVTAYQNQLLPEGRQLLIDDAVENGIFDQVAEDAKAYYEQLLRTLGFEEVRVVVAGY